MKYKFLVFLSVSLLHFANAFSQNGSFRDVTIISQKSGKPISFSLYLPPDYEKSNKAYPVIYHLHSLGDNFRSAWRSLVIKYINYAVNLGIIDDCIIVFPDGYENSMWGNSADGSKTAESDLIDDIIPFVDYFYRTVPYREFRFVQGFSMGGFGAVKFISKYPELFAKAVSLDGGMRTWATLLSGRPQIAKEVFDNNEKLFAEFAPWKYISFYSDILSLDTLFYISVGDFKSLNKTFADSLAFYSIPFVYSTTLCKHDIDCLLDREWLNIAEFYSKSISKTNDINAKVVQSPLRNSQNSILIINYSLEKVGRAKIDLFDTDGNLIMNVVNEFEVSGEFRKDIQINGSLKKGKYILVYDVPNQKRMRKFILIK
ncbi:MAG: esterase family protein [Ignavibacteria bacterium]|nr:esterase family protein [Ignavibacteria bacterium]